MVPSGSVEAVPLKVPSNPVVLEVNDAVGGWLVGGGAVTVIWSVATSVAPSSSVAVSVTV